jgi:hypothetical protein
METRSQLGLGFGIGVRGSGKPPPPYAVLPDAKHQRSLCATKDGKVSENVEECPKATNWNNGFLAKYRGKISSTGLKATNVTKKEMSENIYHSSCCD